MKLQKKLVITYLLIALIPLSIVVLLSYTNMRQALLSEQQISLEAIANLKVKSIQDYFFGISEEIKGYQDNLEIKSSLLTVGSLVAGNGTLAYEQIKGSFDKETQKTKDRRAEIDNIFFVNPSGKITYSSKEGIKGQMIGELFPLFGQFAFERGKEDVYFTDIYVDPRDNNFDFLLSAPIYAADKTFAGVLFFEVNAQKLYSVILSIEGLGQTGEVLLVKRIAAEGQETNEFQAYPYDATGSVVLFLNPLRFAPKAAFKQELRFGDPIGLPAQEAAQGRSGSGVTLDYQGKKVMAVWRYLPEKNWGLVAKINLDELLLPAHRVIEAVLFFTLVAVILIFIISWVLSRTISAPILELAEITKKISQGDLKVKFSEKLTSTRGEIGTLAKGFAVMTANLRELYQNLEKKVKERTKKLEQSETELKKALNDAERLNKLMVGRELDMVKLKEELAKYKNKS